MLTPPRVRARPVLVWLLAASSALVQGAAVPASTHPNDDCQVCHGDESATRSSGKSVFVDSAVFGASVHGQLGLACVDCHADVATAELPHAEALAPARCATCHEESVAAYARSAHAKARSGGQVAAATCSSCHGAHDIRGSNDAESRTYYLTVPATCAACHGSEQVIAQARLPGGNVARQFEDSIHGRALTRGGLVVAPNCVSCHGAHDALGPDAAESRVARTNVPGTCGKCHAGVERRYEQGRHGAQAQGRNTKAPVCSDCHSAHHIQRADIAGWQLGVIQECGTCHEASMATYRDTFHGQVTALGFTRVAKCADCHGAHEVLPTSDRRSPVHADNRVRTCQKCHPGATANFAQYDPHADRHDRASGLVLYYTGAFMDMLLAGVFSFFGIHTTLWFARSYRLMKERRAARQTGPDDDEREADAGA